MMAVCLPPSSPLFASLRRVGAAAVRAAAATHSNGARQSQANPSFCIALVILHFVGLGLHLIYLR